MMMITNLLTSSKFDNIVKFVYAVRKHVADVVGLTADMTTLLRSYC